MIAPTRPLLSEQRSLVARQWRPVAFAGIGAGALVLFVLGALVFHSTSTRFDERVAGGFAHHIGVRATALLLDVTHPAISVVLLIAVGLWTLRARRPDVFALALIAPALATVLAEEVLKPLIGRVLGAQSLLSSGAPGSFPSGHETVACSTALVVLIAASQMRLPWAVLGGLAAVAAVWVVAVAVGLVSNGYHYATDTIGAVGLSIAVVLGVALAIDRYAAAIELRLRVS